MKKRVLEVKEEIQVGNIMLEKGDKISLIREKDQINLKDAVSILNNSKIDYCSLLSLNNKFALAEIEKPDFKSYRDMLEFMGDKSNIFINMKNVHGAFKENDGTGYVFIMILTNEGEYEIGVIL